MEERENKQRQWKKERTNKDNGRKREQTKTMEERENKQRQWKKERTNKDNGRKREQTKTDPSNQLVQQQGLSRLGDVTQVGSSEAGADHQLELVTRGQPDPHVNPAPGGQNKVLHTSRSQFHGSLYTRHVLRVKKSYKLSVDQSISQ